MRTEKQERSDNSPHFEWYPTSAPPLPHVSTSPTSTVGISLSIFRFFFLTQLSLFSECINLVSPRSFFQSDPLFLSNHGETQSSVFFEPHCTRVDTACTRVFDGWGNHGMPTRILPAVVHPNCGDWNRVDLHSPQQLMLDMRSSTTILTNIHFIVKYSPST